LILPLNLVQLSLFFFHSPPNINIEEMIKSIWENIYSDEITKRMSVNSKENNAKEKCFSIPKFRDKGKWGRNGKKKGSAELG